MALRKTLPDHPGMPDRPIVQVLEESKALIFDVDGTLAETEETHRKAFNDTFDHFRLPWEWDATLYGELLKVTGGKERMFHFAEAYPQNGPAITADQIASMHRFKNERFAQLVATGQCPLRPGVRRLIEAAQSRRQQLAIATTTSRSNVEALLASTLGSGAIAIFDAVVAGDEVEAKKPSPDVYLRVLEAIALTGPECLAIEDSRNGLISAIGAGIPALITPSSYSLGEDFTGALAILKDLDAGPASDSILTRET